MMTEPIHSLVSRDPSPADQIPGIKVPESHEAEAISSHPEIRHGPYPKNPEPFGVERHCSTKYAPKSYALHCFDFNLLYLAVAGFYPLLEKNQRLITDVMKKTFKYGETDRHCVGSTSTITSPGSRTLNPDS